VVVVARGHPLRVNEISAWWENREWLGRGHAVEPFF
jgi:hypothetical protein